MRIHNPLILFTLLGVLGAPVHAQSDERIGDLSVAQPTVVKSRNTEVKLQDGDSYLVYPNDDIKVGTSQDWKDWSVLQIPETGTIRIGSDTHVVVRRKGEDYIVESNYGLLCYSFKVCDKDASEDDCHRVFLRWDSKEFELTAKTGRGRVGVSAGRGEGYLVQQGENGGRNPVTDLPAARVLPVGHAIARLVDAQLGPDAAWCGCQSGLFAMPVNPGVAIPLVGAAAVANRPTGRDTKREDDVRPSSPVAPLPQ
ncbi:MAG: hypothetical protein WAT36_00415 [Chromatiaceae bacterium]